MASRASALLASLAVLLWACGSDSPSSPTGPGSATGVIIRRGP